LGEELFMAGGFLCVPQLTFESGFEGVENFENFVKKFIDCEMRRLSRLRAIVGEKPKIRLFLQLLSP
jgi:hypothetical protein